MGRLNLHLRILQQAVDAEFKQRVDAHAKAGHAVTCKRGCNGCCYFLVTACFIEIVQALELAKANGAFAKLAAKMDQARADFEAIIDPSTTCNSWWHDRRPCFFLDTEAGDCLVYEARPYTCRAYNVVSDPALCWEDAKTKVLLVNMGRGDDLGRYWTASNEIAHDAGIPDVHAPLAYLLPLAMLWCDGMRAEAVAVLKRDGAFDNLERWLMRWARLEIDTIDLEDNDDR